MTTRHRLSGRLTVALPPAEAFPLFTARGEQAWAEGWRPAFPHATDDDSAPGTVFVTSAHGGPTTWVVTECDPGRRIRYARFTPNDRAGTVTVALADADGRSEVTVDYDMTALSDAGVRELATFAAGYPAFLRSWRDAIEKALGTTAHGTTAPERGGLAGGV